MKIKVSWGSVLRTLREKYNLTQAEIAEILHISRPDYVNIEGGRHQPSAEMIAILTDIYETDLYRYAINSLPDDLVAEQTRFKAYMYSIPRNVEDEEQIPRSNTYYGQKNEDILKHLDNNDKSDKT